MRNARYPLNPKSTTTNALVQKLWNYCNVLRNDGISDGDYVEPGERPSKKASLITKLASSPMCICANSYAF